MDSKVDSVEATEVDRRPKCVEADELVDQTAVVAQVDHAALHEVENEGAVVDGDRGNGSHLLGGEQSEQTDHAVDVGRCWLPGDSTGLNAVDLSLIHI